MLKRMQESDEGHVQQVQKKLRTYGNQGVLWCPLTDKNVFYNTGEFRFDVTMKSERNSIRIVMVSLSVVWKD